ncbi:hypothetical protein [Christensenella intestinihominis]|uniref:hypothetical protein n=1 Tax=Christensenella intestinihominis TaxID=1851429 RepID=UPI000832BAB2|nr:hypothetical protein [Christensenella intestinihominis]
MENGKTNNRKTKQGALRKALCTVLAMVIAAGAVMVAAPKTARAWTDPHPDELEGGSSGYEWSVKLPMGAAYPVGARLMEFSQRGTKANGKYEIWSGKKGTSTGTLVHSGTMARGDWLYRIIQASDFPRVVNGESYMEIYMNTAPGGVMGLVWGTKILFDRTPPKLSNAKQNTDDWAESKTISVVAWESDNPNSTYPNCAGTLSAIASGPQSPSLRLVSGSIYGESTWQATVTKAGTYTIKVQDNASNVSTTTVTVTNIDNTPPVIANVALDPADGFAGSRTIQANITDADIGLDESRIFLTTNPDETDASKGLPLVKDGDRYSIEMATEGTYYIVAYDKMNHKACSSAIVVKDIDGDPPVMAGIRCKNTSRGFEVTFKLEDAVTGVDNNTVKYGADPAGPGDVEITYNSLKKEYSFLLPTDGSDYWIFASDKVGNAMAPVQVPRLWLPHVTGTGDYTNDGATGEDIKSGEVGIETYGHIGEMPKTGVDLDGDGTVDAIAPESDMIDVTVPMSVMMYASWDNFSEKKNFVAPVGMVVNNNLTAPVKVEITGFEPESPAGTISLLPMDAEKGDGGIGVLVKPAGSGGAVKFLPTDITAVSADAALQMGTLAGGEGVLYTFEGDYGKGLVQYHKNEQLTCKSVFRFSRA